MEMQGFDAKLCLKMNWGSFACRSKHVRSKPSPKDRPAMRKCPYFRTHPPSEILPKKIAQPELGLMDGPMDVNRFISMLYWLIAKRWKVLPAGDLSNINGRCENMFFGKVASRVLQPGHGVQCQSSSNDSNFCWRLPLVQQLIDRSFSGGGPVRNGPISPPWDLPRCADQNLGSNSQLHRSWWKLLESACWLED